MFFKRLELFGFKSFAERIKLDFEAGVTAIVGPNGCGKSNIADSIKWVLGEQSVRSMRGSHMEDVIFHGADNVAAVGFAEVSITISNEQKTLPLDYDEVTITRRIFRSGESEYLVNKVPVRLKDVSELLMGTGMGVPSYSLMQQGKVDMILSSRPDERRAIFEEVAGITKYKAKREEALRKLDRTQDNLQRIGDITVEVKRQIKSMERQVNRARRYKQEFERLKEFEINVSQHSFQQLKKEKAELKAKAAELEERERFFNSKINTTTHSLAQARNELSSLEENMSHIQAESYEVSATIKTASNKINLDQERIEELNHRSEYLAQQIQEISEKLASIAEQREQAQVQIDEIEQNKQEKSALAAEKEQSIDMFTSSLKQAQKEVSAFKIEEVELLAQKTRRKNDLAKLEANLSNFNARLRRLNMESEKTEEDVGAATIKVSDCQAQITAIRDEVQTITRELWDLKSNHDVQVEKRQKLERCSEELSRRIAAHNSALNFLKELTKKYEGFSNGVKAILSAKESGKLNVSGLDGVVANLIKVSPQYQLAIEVALGESAQAIIVETRHAAQEVIEYLRSNDAGRAKFICLNSLSGDVEKKAKPADVIGKASEIIQVENKHRKLIQHLLGRTFVVKNKDSVSNLLMSLDFFDKLVTLQGELFSKASIVAGSDIKNSNSSLLGRQARIQNMQKELDAMNSEQEELEQLKNEKIEKIESLTTLIQEKEPNLNTVQIKLASKEHEQKNIETEKKRFADEVSLLKLEIDETKEQLESIQKDQNVLKEEVVVLSEKEDKLQENIHRLQELIASEDQKRQQSQIEVAQLKATVLALDRETEARKSRLSALIETENDQTKTQERNQQEIENTVAKVTELTEDIEQLKLQACNLAQSKEALNDKINRTAEKRKQLYENIGQLDKESHSEQKSLNFTRQEKSSFEVKLTEFSYKQESLKEKMEQSYQVDLEASLENIMEISPPDDSIFEEIKQLKGKLEGMGAVNLIAIEENDQLQQRYSFLVTQQEDLVSGQESLRKAITQINRTARGMFADTFAKVQANFKEYFRVLFNGGDARVILLDENNILESGIEIVVRPPGKKMQNISLLSGGEKALTAIALLFAIFKVKPSPFCILDEVDASLDESNVDRFTNLLREFIKTSQFIIITHNKKTINMADVMYGITMQRSGISKIVSVKFTDDTKEPAKETIPAKV